MVYTVLILKCTECGFECCQLCREEHRDALPEHTHEYAALLCFEQDQIAELEAFAQHWSEQPLWEPECAIPKTELRTQPPAMHVISADALNTDTLIYFLSRGIPLVITGVSTQINWDPVAMTFHFGDLGCVIEDAARLNTPRRGTVADFYAPWISQQMRPEEGLLMKKARLSVFRIMQIAHVSSRISRQRNDWGTLAKNSQKTIKRLFLSKSKLIQKVRLT